MRSTEAREPVPRSEVEAERLEQLNALSEFEKGLLAAKRQEAADAAAASAQFYTDWDAEASRQVPAGAAVGSGRPSCGVLQGDCRGRKVKC
jgi:hypothetical protein